MRCVFIGTVEVSWHCLKTLLDLEEVVAIFTAVDNNDGRISAYKAFDDLGRQYAVPVHRIANINAPEVVQQIRALRPDAIFCIGWPRLVKEPILSLPSKGCIGMHSSLLPKYRGGAPVNWGLINGETRWGISLMHLGTGADNGDIIGQATFDVGPDETCGEVYDKVTEAAMRALRTYVPMIANGTAPRVAQDESQATFYKQRKPGDGQIDWRRTARQLHDWTRALTHPYPGAFTFLEDGTKVTVWAARLTDDSKTEAEPGVVLRVVPFEGILVQCGSGQLLLRRVQAEGAGEMAATVWAAHRSNAEPWRFVESQV